MHAGQINVTAQAWDADPQSTPASVQVFFGVQQMPPGQVPPAQSPPTLHVAPSLHFGHVVPPQSVADSRPFFTPSVQVAPRHTPPPHERLVQSPPVAHPLPTMHREHEPPQSTSVSLPFRVPSPQEAAWQVPALQTPL